MATGPAVSLAPGGGGVDVVRGGEEGVCMWLGRIEGRGERGWGWGSRHHWGVGSR